MPLTKPILIASFSSLALFSSSVLASQAESQEILEELKQMQNKIAQLEEQLASKEDKKVNDDGISVGGAVRFQYSLEDYNQENKSRGGDLDFDVFRLNFDGKVGGITLSAEWRWYQYMNIVHHAWLGYDINPNSQLQLGINQVPFGVSPYNSNSFFFSSNFYVGLEDDYDFGLKYLYKKADWDLRLGFYFNDEQGGIDGFVDNREDRYSYDIAGVRTAGEGTYDAPANKLAEANTVNARLTHTFKPQDDLSIELGASVQYGGLNDGNSSAGDNQAYAVHLVGNYGRWNVQLQATHYEYDLDSGEELIAVAAYSFYDTIATEADTYTANLAYSLPVAWGPISNLRFYNDYSLVGNKSGDLEDTWMNVTGVLVSAGALYTYIDVIHAENQPFVNGTMVGDGDTEKRININFGYYF